MQVQDANDVPYLFIDDSITILALMLSHSLNRWRTHDKRRVYVARYPSPFDSARPVAAAQSAVICRTSEVAEASFVNLPKSGTTTICTWHGAHLK